MRDISAQLLAAFESGVLIPFFAATLTFSTGTQNVWTGVGNLTTGGVTYSGVGSFAEMGPISETSTVEAQGTYVRLSGIDPVYLGDSINDVQPGLPATLWIGAMDQSSTVLGMYQIFGGIIDQPTVQPGTDTFTITLNLEGKIVDFSRASQLKYTSADQRAVYPHDSGFDTVELMNDIALKPWQ